MDGMRSMTSYLPSFILIVLAVSALGGDSNTSAKTSPEAGALPYSSLMYGMESSQSFQEPGFRYTRRINTIWGATPDLSALSEDRKLELGRASLDRATLLGDAYEFALRVGADYAAWRDTAEVVERTAGAPVFRGIHLALNGDRDQAQGVLQRAAAEISRASGPLGDLAHDWAGVVDGRSERVWEYHFLEGRSVLSESCGELPSGSGRHARCVLAAELTAGDVAAVARRQRSLMADPSPDHVDGGARYLEVTYHDPLRLLILARADGWMVHEVLGHRSEPAVRLAAARGLARAARYAEAEAILRELEGSIAEAERGAALYSLGQTTRAREIWSDLERRGGDAELLALEAASRFGLFGDGARRRALSAVRGDFQGLTVPRSLLLARALLRAGEGELALLVLQSQYRRSWHNDLTRVPAEMLLLLAHAKYLSGRDHYSEAREHMVVLSREDAVLGGILTMLQELTAPERPTSDRSRTGGN